jgi:hypothetical protein
MKSVESDDSSQAKAYATVEWPSGCYLKNVYPQAKVYATAERPLGCFIKM